jgi:cytochrome c556
MNQPMISSRWPASLVLALVAALAAFLVHSAMAQVKQGKARPLTTSQLMKGMAKPSSTALKDGLAAAPADDKAWDQLAMHAALLNEVSFILMEDGRCPDAVWSDAATKSLREGSADLLKAIQARNAGDARAAFGSMMKSCKACHDKHKE